LPPLGRARKSGEAGKKSGLPVWQRLRLSLVERIRAVAFIFPFRVKAALGSFRFLAVQM
jgi:hypothetical protein